MPDVLPTLGNTNWLLIVATKILEIGWMLLKTSTGGNPIWTTSSTSAGFDCKLNFVYIFCNLSRFISFSRLCPMGPAIFWRTGSTRLDSTLADEGTCKENAQTVRGMRHVLVSLPLARMQKVLHVGENSCGALGGICPKKTVTLAYTSSVKTLACYG